jgi:hypothetical protein
VPPELIADYHQNFAFPLDPAPKQEAIHAYIDYSLGMGEGMRSNTTITDGLKRFLDGRQTVFYRVGVVDEPEIIDLNQPRSNFLDLNNFTDDGSKLKVVLDRIAAAPGRSAIFITDFEHVNPAPAASYAGAPAPHRIDVSAWGQVPFRQWLAAGNRIDVFAHRYAKPDYWFEKNVKNTYDNWIYTLVFTPRWVMQDKDAYRRSALAYLLEGTGSRSSDSDRHYHYWADGFEVTATADPNQGNASEDLPVMATASWPAPQSFDWHQFTVGELLGFAENTEIEDRRILKGVKLSNSTGFLDSVQLAIRTTDVSSTLEALKAFREAPPLETKTDAETGRVDTLQPPPSPYRYDAGRTLDLLFSVVHNPETGEIGIKAGPEIGAITAPMTLRVDVLLESAIQLEAPNAANILSLQYSSGYRIPAFAESLRLAARDLTADIVGKRVIHTSYITITR